MDLLWRNQSKDTAASLVTHFKKCVCGPAKRTPADRGNAFFFHLSEGERETKKERGEGASGVSFFYEKKARCVKNRSSFCHAAVPIALLSPPLAFVSLPPIAAALSTHLLLSFSLPSHLFDLPPPKFSSLFIPFPVNAVSVCVCECV